MGMGSGMLTVRHEEEAVIWMWAFPQLACWPRPIEWLYTPVVGKARWPGDLWGIDDSGELLIVECKQCRRADDPYIDFLEYHRPIRDEVCGIHWVAKFKRHLKAELRFRDGIQERPPGRTGGILPRSNRRTHFARWPHLAAMIDERIRGDGYLERVIQHLNLRIAQRDPLPHYMALLVRSAEVDTPFADRALESAALLQTLVGAERVSAVVVCAMHVTASKLAIQAERVTPMPPAAPVSAHEV
jgi:hypothetical protein